MSKTTNKFSPEVRERAVRMVLDGEGQHGSRWQAVMSISAKIGCAPQTLGRITMARDFDRQVAELHVRIAVLNGYTRLGIPVTEAVG